MSRFSQDRKDRSTVVTVEPLSNGLWSVSLYADGDLALLKDDCKAEHEALSEGLLMLCAAVLAEERK